MAPSVAARRQGTSLRTAAIALLLLVAACGAEDAPPAEPPVTEPPPPAPITEPTGPVQLTPEQVQLAIAEIVRSGEPLLQKEIEVTFLALMDEEVTWRQVRGPYEAQVMREAVERRRAVVEQGRIAFQNRTAAIEKRAAELMPPAEQAAAKTLGDNLRASYAAFFDVLTVELEQLDAYSEMIRILSDPAQSEWTNGKGYFRSLQAGRRHDELQQQVRDLEQRKHQAMDRLQAKIARTGDGR